MESAHPGHSSVIALLLLTGRPAKLAGSRRQRSCASVRFKSSLANLANTQR